MSGGHLSFLHFKKFSDLIWQRSARIITKVTAEFYFTLYLINHNSLFVSFVSLPLSNALWYSVILWRIDTSGLGLAR